MVPPVAIPVAVSISVTIPMIYGTAGAVAVVTRAVAFAITVTAVVILSFFGGVTSFSRGPATQ